MVGAGQGRAGQGGDYGKPDGGKRKFNGEYFASGIYAHAPAKHVYNLAKRWQKLSGRCGIQDGYRGKVQFEIVGDGGDGTASDWGLWIEPTLVRKPD